MAGPLMLTVIQSTRLAGGMQRVILTGDGLSRIPQYHAGLHIKMLIPQAHQQQPVLPTWTEEGIQWPAKELKPISRTYSIRHYDRELNHLTVDFVLHQEPGPASDWAQNCQPGDKVGFAGPGLTPLYDVTANELLLIGDKSAVPAINAVINEAATRHASMKIRVLIEHQGDAPELEIEAQHQDADIEVQFLPQRIVPEQTILPAVAKLELDLTSASIMVAGEHHTVAAMIRTYKNAGINKKRVYAVPYWKYQHSEEAYHVARHEFMDAVMAADAE